MTQVEVFVQFVPKSNPPGAWDVQFVYPVTANPRRGLYRLVLEVPERELPPRVQHDLKLVEIDHTPDPAA